MAHFVEEGAEGSSTGATQQAEDVMNLKKWLKANILSKLAPYFDEQEAEMEDLLTMSEAAVKEMWSIDAVAALSLSEIYKDRFKRALSKLQQESAGNGDIGNVAVHAQIPAVPVVVTRTEQSAMNKMRAKLKEIESALKEVVDRQSALSMDAQQKAAEI